MHIITLSFDDGLEKSNLKIAEIYEKFGLSACFNVIALGHTPDFIAPDPYHQGYPKGNFALWNELQDRGHEIMPHGLLHHNLAEMPLEKAQRAITRCLEIFTRELNGFNPEKSIYNFAYNASTPELDAWLPGLVRAYRTGGDPINPLPYTGQVKLTTTGHGPGNCEHHLDALIEKLFSQDEGWGPVRADYLEELLGRLITLDNVHIMPAYRALQI